MMPGSLALTCEADDRRMLDSPDRLIETIRALKKIPKLIDRIDQYYPPFGAAPPPPPLPEVDVIGHRHWWGYGAVALAAAAAGALAMLVLG